MPGSKYFDRPGNGLNKQNLGMDNEDLGMSIKPASEQHQVMAMPSTPTQDKERNQDGNHGKPFFKTLMSRHGKASDHSMQGKSHAGPNAQ